MLYSYPGNWLVRNQILPDIVTIHFYCVKKNSFNILWIAPFGLHGKTKVIQISKDMRVSKRWQVFVSLEHANKNMESWSLQYSWRPECTARYRDARDSWPSSCRRPPGFQRSALGWQSVLVVTGPVPSDWVRALLFSATIHSSYQASRLRRNNEKDFVPT